MNVAYICEYYYMYVRITTSITTYMYEFYTTHMHEVLDCMRIWRLYTYWNITTCTCILLHLLPQHIWILHHTHAWVRLNIIQYVWFLQYVSTLHYTYAGGHMRIATYNWMYRALIEYIWILHYTYAWVRISYNIYEYIIQYIWIYTQTIYMYITLHIRMSAYVYYTTHTHECVYHTIYMNILYNIYEYILIQYICILHYTYAWVCILHYTYAWVRICMSAFEYYTICMIHTVCMNIILYI